MSTFLKLSSIKLLTFSIQLLNILRTPQLSCTLDKMAPVTLKWSIHQAHTTLAKSKPTFAIASTQ